MVDENENNQNNQLDESSKSPIQLDELAELDIKIAEIETRLVRQKKNRNSFAIGAAILVFVAGIVIGTFRQDLFPYDELNTGQIVAMTLAFGIFLPLYFYLALGINISPRQREYEQLVSRRKVLVSLSPKRFDQNESVETSYFERLVQINVTNLAEYYAMVKVHTDNSFKVSIVAGSIGFVLIILGAAIGFSNNSDMKTIAYISSGAGIITEFISSIFFYLYNRTVRQLKDYHDSLIDVQNVLLSFKIVGDLSDEKDRVKMVSEMLKFLIGKEIKSKE